MASLARFWNSEKSVKLFRIWWTRRDSNPRPPSFFSIGTDDSDWVVEIWWTRWDSNPRPPHCEQWGK